MGHKKPYRPTHDVTQEFNDGIVGVYSVRDSSEGTGRVPTPVLELINSFRYAAVKLGVTRYYSALQNQIHVSRVIRIPFVKTFKITNQDIAKTEDGEFYRIDFIQSVNTTPPALDLTLVKYEQNVNEEGEAYVEI